MEASKQKRTAKGRRRRRLLEESGTGLILELVGGLGGVTAVID